MAQLHHRVIAAPFSASARRLVHPRPWRGDALWQPARRMSGALGGAEPKTRRDASWASDARGWRREERSGRARHGSQRTQGSGTRRRRATGPAARAGRTELVKVARVWLSQSNTPSALFAGAYTLPLACQSHFPHRRPDHTCAAWKPAWSLALALGTHRTRSNLRALLSPSIQTITRCRRSDGQRLLIPISSHSRLWRLQS